MNQDVVVSLLTAALELGFKIALPVMGTALVVGVLVSVFQAVTQIQEMSLSFVPKLLASAVVLVLAGPWTLSQLVAYTDALYRSIPSMVGP